MREAWRTAQADLDPKQLIFLDETSTPLTLTPLRARAPLDDRVRLDQQVLRDDLRHDGLLSAGRADSIPRRPARGGAPRRRLR